MFNRFVPACLLVLPFLVANANLAATEAGWGTDLDAGKARAAKEKKILVVYFTGSAWCPPCKLLHAELLPSKAFAEFAKEKVLVMLDYPPMTGRSEEKIKANPGLGKLMQIKDQYKVKAFPTMVVLGPDGQEKGRKMGFEKNKAPEAYLTELVK
jgi:thiol-disulfide isomerase/thioredoxin